MSAQEHKLIISGTMGAGKTTAISAISEIEVVNTEAVNHDRTATKPTTTVAMDYGELTLSNGDRLRLYGTPGQRRFEFMWQVLADNALGVIVLLDNSREAALSDLQEYLKVFHPMAVASRMVIGVGRHERHHVPTVDDYQQVLRRHGLMLPVFSVDIRRRDDVLLLIEVLLDNIECDLVSTNRGSS